MSRNGVDFHHLNSLLQHTNSETIHQPTETILPLPEKYEILYDQTKALLSALKALYTRRLASTFPKIKDFVELQTKHTFNLTTLSKCFKILPEGTLVFDWKEDKRKNITGTQQLHILNDSPKSITYLNEYSRQYLLNIVKDEHKKFLIKNHEKVPKEIKVWHHNFDLNSVPDIVGVELKPPEIPKQKSIFASLQPIIKKTELTISQIPTNEPEKRVPKSCQNLRSYFDVVKKVQEKVSLNQTLLQIGSHKESEDILKLSDIINLTFTCRDKKVMPLKDIIPIVQKNKAFLSVDNKQIISLLDKLSEKSDGYFSKIQLGGLDYIKIDDKRNYQMVRGPIYRSVLEIPL